MKRFLFFLTLILISSAIYLLGQDSGYPPRQVAPGLGPENESSGLEPENDPSRGVARISLLNGEVSVRRGDTGDVVAASLNAPLVTQDRILTSSSSRAEVQFDYADILRIGSNSEVRLNDVQQRRLQVQIAIGTITFHVRANSQAEVEIDTPNISFRPLGPGSYRVMVHEDGTSEISVRDGEAEIFGPRGAERLRAGVTIFARGSADDPEFREVAPIGLDDWDRWNLSRDRQLETSRSYDYVSPDIAGAEDLEGYGRWANDPQYGNVWVPRVEAGWAPYRSGRWVWEDYYGWTWVSYDPWGWAPYHYGRWYSGPFGWAWYPGPRHERHYWSPALVAFFGFGGYGGFHSGVGFGFGNVGWVPLAPYERFHPWWGRGVYRGFGGDRGFGNHTTIVNNTNITNVYRNARVNNGITAVGASDFGRHTGRFVGLSGASVRDAGLVRGVLPVSPDRSSLRLADRQVRAGAFPQDRNINFAGRRSNTQVRVPFDQQQRSMDQVARQTFGASQALGSSAGSSNQGSRRSVYPGSQPQLGQQSGPQQGGQQQPQAVQPQSPQGGFSQRGGTAGTATHGWSRFGEPIHGSIPDSGGRMNPPQTYPGTTGNYGSSVNRGAYPSPPQSSGQRSYYDNGGSRRWGGPPVYQSPQTTAPQSTYQQYSRPAQQYSAPSAPVRISQPMVRERSSFGGGGAPRSAPQPTSAPAHQSGGGGSGNHTSGGSNNGGRQGGGRR